LASSTACSTSGCSPSKCRITNSRGLTSASASDLYSASPSAAAAASSAAPPHRRRPAMSVFGSSESVRSTTAHAAFASAAGPPELAELIHHTNAMIPAPRTSPRTPTTITVPRCGRAEDMPLRLIPAACLPGFRPAAGASRRRSAGFHLHVVDDHRVPRLGLGHRSPFARDTVGECTAHRDVEQHEVALVRRHVVPRLVADLRPGDRVELLTVDVPAQLVG